MGEDVDDRPRLGRFRIDLHAQREVGKRGSRRFDSEAAVAAEQVRDVLAAQEDVAQAVGDAADPLGRRGFAVVAIVHAERVDDEAVGGGRDIGREDLQTPGCERPGQFVEAAGDHVGIGRDDPVVDRGGLGVEVSLDGDFLAIEPVHHHHVTRDAVRQRVHDVGRREDAELLFNVFLRRR